MTSPRNNERSAILQLISHMPGAVALFSSDEFRIRYINDAYRKFLPQAFQGRDLVGVRTAELTIGGESGPILALIRQVSQDHEKVEFEELRYRNRDGREFWVEWSGIPVENGTGSADVLVQMRDITESKHQEETIRESEERFRSTMDSMMEGCQIIGRDWRYIYINDAAERHNRRPREELLGNEYTDMWPGVRSTRVYAVLRRCMEERTAQSMENEFTFPDGATGWFELQISPVPEGIFILSVDITERKRAGDALKESETRYRGLFETVKEAFYISHLVYDEHGSDADWVYEDVNPAGLEVLSAGSLDEVKGKRGSEVIGRDTVRFYLPLIERAKCSGRSEVFDYCSPLNGHDFISSFVVIGDRWIASQRDITDIKRAQRQAERERIRLQAVLDAAPIGIFIGDETGKTVLLNEAVYKIWGWDLPTPESTKVYRQFKAWFADTGEELGTEDWPGIKALKGEESSTILDIQRFDGGRRTIIDAAVPLRDEMGSIYGYLATIQDITEIRQTEEALKRSNAELQQFAYVASHDLQEPLRMVMAYLTLLEKKYGDRLDDKARQYMHFAVEGGGRAKDLVQDLLEFSRIDSRAKPFEPTSMEEVLGQVTTTLGVQIKEEGGTVTHDPLPTIMADDNQMAQLLQNLINNAIKFHGDEPPRVHISAQEWGQGWLFSVRDNGIGIDPVYADKVFVLFQRLHSREEYEGTGIGLAISKKIVEHHGGRIWFESEEGKGATFLFTIPKRPRT